MRDVEAGAGSGRVAGSSKNKRMQISLDTIVSEVNV
jgi:hypothetical protein